MFILLNIDLKSRGIKVDFLEAVSVRSSCKLHQHIFLTQNF